MEKVTNIKSLNEIFKKLNVLNIRYCHWKSNASLKNAFKSRTDFDLLIAREDLPRFQLLMHELGIKRRFHTPENIYPGMEHYLGFDEETGKLFHFHVHYKLIVGKKYSKNYRIPLERLALDNFILHEKYQIKIINPELELILLIIRSFLKIKLNFHLFVTSILKQSLFPLNINNEYRYLLQKINKKKFQEICLIYFSDISSNLINFLSQYNKRNSYHLIRSYRKKIISGLKEYKRAGKKTTRTNKKIRKLAKKESKSYFPAGGVSIAFIGADGSGKSMITQLIVNWLGWKLSVSKLYMGIPKSARIYKLINMIISISRLFKIKKLINLLKNMRWIYVAYSRYQTFRRSLLLVNQGTIVIFDRYPLKYFWDMERPMDGPRLNPESFLGKIERSYYKKIKPPDYFLILNVTIEDSINRKTEHGNIKKRMLIKEKIDAIEKLRKSEFAYSFVFNTHEGLEKTLMNVKKKLWEIL